MNCPHCGRDVVPVEGQKFCSWCGEISGDAPRRRPMRTRQGKVPRTSIFRLIRLKSPPLDGPNAARGRIRKISASYKEFLRLSGRAFFHPRIFLRGSLGEAGF